MIYLYTIFAQNCGACLSFKDKKLKSFLESIKKLEHENKLKYIQIDLQKMGQMEKIPSFLREYIHFYPSFIIIDNDSTVKIFGHHVTRGSDGHIKLVSLPTKSDSLLDWIQGVINGNKKLDLPKIENDGKTCKYKIIGRRK